MTATTNALRPGADAAPAGGARPRKAEHGTRSKYVGGCRCEPCSNANTDYRRAHKERLKDLPFRMVPHGLTGYNEFSCRCDTCRAAKKVANRRQYEKAAAE